RSTGATASRGWSRPTSPEMRPGTPSHAAVGRTSSSLELVEDLVAVVAEEAAHVVERRAATFLRGHDEARHTEIGVLLREVEVDRAAELVAALPHRELDRVGIATVLDRRRADLFDPRRVVLG